MDRELLISFAANRVVKAIILSCILLLSTLMLSLVGCSKPAQTQVDNPAPIQKPATPLTSSTSAFKFSDLTISPAELQPGEEIIITAKLTNTDTTEASYTAEVRINNVAEAVKEVTLPAGETLTLKFPVSRDVPGNYIVTVGEATGQFLVVKPEELRQATDPKTTTPELAVAPNFTGIDVVTNKTLSLTQFKGSVVLLNFVNYGCSSSLNMTVSSQLFVIRDLLKQRSDFVPVSIFCGCCSPDVLRDFAKQNSLAWPWILDTDNSIIPQYMDYLIEHGYPTLIFIDANQRINEVTGYRDFFALDEKINKLR